MECFLSPTSEDEVEDTKPLVTTVFVKEEPQCKTERCDLIGKSLFPNLNNVHVKDEPAIDPQMLPDIMIDVEVTCLTERVIKNESVSQCEELGATDDRYILTNHGNEIKVCITKESCSSLDGSVNIDKDPYECKICQKIFNSKASLSSHILIHDIDRTSLKIKTNNKFQDEEIITCKLCQQQFPSLSTYLKHRQKMHLHQKPFTCEICEKEFNSKYLLSNHERIHTGEKPYPCEVCDKRFSEQVNLNRHKRTHTGAKPHSCDRCQKKFSLKHNLTLHLRSHTKERPFECETCNRRFPHSSDLRRHQRSHTGEKRFSCDICKKSFARKHYLPYHIQSHNNERPVACEICDKKFLSIHDCKKHLKIHMTKPKCFMCHICQQEFTHKLHLTKHTQQNHPLLSQALNKLE